MHSANIQIQLVLEWFYSKDKVVTKIKYLVSTWTRTDNIIIDHRGQNIFGFKAISDPVLCLQSWLVFIVSMIVVTDTNRHFLLIRSSYVVTLQQHRNLLLSNVCCCCGHAGVVARGGDEGQWCWWGAGVEQLAALLSIANTEQVIWLVTVLTEAVVTIYSLQDQACKTGQFCVKTCVTGAFSTPGVVSWTWHKYASIL